MGHYTAAQMREAAHANEWQVDDIAAMLRQGADAVDALTAKDAEIEQVWRQYSDALRREAALLGLEAEVTRQRERSIAYEVRMVAAETERDAADKSARQMQDRLQRLVDGAWWK